MIDRLVHHAEILSLKGDSYRLRGKDLGDELRGGPPVRQSARLPAAVGRVVREGQQPPAPGLRCRPVDRFAEELEVMRALPARELDLDRRLVMRVPPDPYLRFDTNDYSLAPGFVARRVEVRVSQQRVTATVLDSGEQAANHERSFAKHRTITALEHARALKILRGERRGVQIDVEQRSLDVYDALMA
jgi:hypothetical protein